MVMDEIEVVEWTGYERASQRKDSIGGMGGFFEEGRRWRDYIEIWKDRAKPYAEAIRRAVLKERLRTTGWQHQEGMAPVFSDGTAGTFSYRAWGDLMAAIWAEEEDKDYHYMEFYM